MNRWHAKTECKRKEKWIVPRVTVKQERVAVQCVEYAEDCREDAVHVCMESQTFTSET